MGLREGNDILERRLLDALFLALETSQLFKCGQDEATVDVPWCVSTGFAVPVGFLPMGAVDLHTYQRGLLRCSFYHMGNAKASKAERATVQAHVFLLGNLNKYRDRASPAN